ncbi:D-alanyl-D-alanine carboxypeptidase family protein [Falsiroseomonas sp. CW058]|uniref:D-alanyl-D-alanine carboxypeptidase family protein n=1 Tax=Falsiroseomonas sp. CW058 TaxID=3388664 RepID=UPI003D3129FF
MFLRLASRAGLAALAALALAATPARAQIGSDRYSAILLDHRTGSVLVSASPDETRHPASLTKMMTLYMVFEALRDGRLTLASAVPMSEEAASRPPSKLGVPPGFSISVEQAILALVTRSANDVAAAVGERIGGSEARFAQMMTMRARALGMTRTTFRNASGLPDPDQVTTARDMATLGRRLMQDFPDRYHYFGVTNAVVRGSNLRNHNGMLRTYDGVDGIKTGYIRDSGFNIVTSASRGGQRLVGAVFGGSSWAERDAHMASLLDQGFQTLGVAVASGDRPGLGLVRSAEAAPVRTVRAEAPVRAARAEAPTRTTRAGTTTRSTTTRSVASNRSAAAPVRPVSTTAARGMAPRQAAARTRAAAAPPTMAARPAVRTPSALPNPLVPPTAPQRFRTAEIR